MEQLIERIGKYNEGATYNYNKFRKTNGLIIYNEGGYNATFISESDILELANKIITKKEK